MGSEKVADRGYCVQTFAEAENLVCNAFSCVALEQRVSKDHPLREIIS